MVWVLWAVFLGGAGICLGTLVCLALDHWAVLETEG